MSARLTALVPMRHESERVPGKNFKSFAGRPLFHWILETLLACDVVAEIVVDTDSPEIMRGAARHFPQVRVLERPPHLRGGDVPMNDIVLFDLSATDAEFLLQTHSTNPLLRPETIVEAGNRFLAGFPEYDSLFSVSRVQKRLWNASGRAINHNPAVLLRTQDLPPVFEENSCLYFFNREGMIANRNRIGRRPQMFETDRVEAWDIDDEVDFRVGELLLLQRRNDVRTAP